MRSTITTALAVLLVAVSRTRAAHLPDLGAGGGACVGPCSAGSGGTIGKDVVYAELNLDSLCFTVQWDNNFTASAALMDEEKEDCIFRGIFVDDDDSDVLVTGCPGDEQAIQFHSNKYGDLIFTVTKEGKIKPVEPDAGFTAEDEPLFFSDDDFFPVIPENNSRVKRQADYEYFALDESLFESDSLEDLPALDDYEIDDELLPKTVEVQLNIYIDPAFQQKHGRGTRSVLRQVLAQAGQLFKHQSLKTKVQLVHSNRFYTSNKHLRFNRATTVSKDFYRVLPSLLRNPYTVNGHPVAHVYFTVPDGGTVKGVALAGSMCSPPSSRKGRPRAIVAWNTDVATTGVTMAHEVGHILGMYHDFSTKNSDGFRTSCSRKRSGHFILSYGNFPKRTMWSDCSNQDFKAYYFKVRLGSDDRFCLQETGGAASKSTCSSREYECQRGGRCIPSSQRCDGRFRNCPGGDDELDCVFDFSGFGFSGFGF